MLGCHCECSLVNCCCVLDIVDCIQISWIQLARVAAASILSMKLKSHRLCMRAASQPAQCSIVEASTERVSHTQHSMAGDVWEMCVYVSVQVMLAELLQHWGSGGLDSHLKALQTVYKRRALLMHTAAKQVCP